MAWLLPLTALLALPMQAQTPAGICDRTPQVRDGILSLIGSGTACGDVTNTQLAAINGSLNLTDQGLTSLKMGDFDGLTHLATLGLHTNALTALPGAMFRDLTHLQALDLHTNALTALPEDMFLGLTHLFSFSIHTNALTALPEDVFRGLTNLFSLGLHTNALTALPEDVFRGLTNLFHLIIRTNALTALPEGVFLGLTHLQNLDLRPNALTALPEDVFRGLTNLQLLDLRANALTALPEGVFRGLTHLQNLLLGSNALTALPEDVFCGLTNLQLLDLRANALTALPEDVFRGLTHLRNLDLRNNDLTALPGDVFRGLSHLQILNLDDNALMMLTEDVFLGLSSLEHLSLAGNALTALPPDVFRDLTHLQTLDLSYNVLAALPGALLDDLQARVGLEVNLQGNPGFGLGAPKWDPVSITGDSSNRVDLVIVSEGYTASEMDQFNQDVNAVHAGLFSEDPFLEYAHYFNVWKVEVSSNESGADHPEQTPPLMRDTAFDASFSGRSILVNERKVFRAIGGLPPVARDSVVVLVNDPAYGGSGGRTAVAATGGHGDSLVEVVLHELGHVLANLADEYVELSRLTAAECKAILSEPPHVNLTRETNPSAIKWRHWIDFATPIPTTTSSETPRSEGVPGLYEGGGYCAEGIFRSTRYSKMRNFGAPWKQINTEQWVRVFYDYVSPIDAWTPSTTQLTLLRGRSQTFAVTPMSPATHDIQMDWSVDGAPMGSKSSFILDTTALTIGDHVVTAGASDNTSRVRNDPFQVLSAQQNWTVTIVPVWTESFSFPDLGGWSTTSSGTAETVRVGYGRIHSDFGSATPSGIAIFQFRDSEGVLISEAGVPATKLIQEGRIFAEVNGPVNTGLALANPNGETAIIRFYFTDTQGTDFGSGSFELGALQQTATFLDQPPFNGGSTVRGTFTFESSGPIAVIALRGFTNEADEFLMTTLPVAPLSPASEETVYFPHFVAGGGWVTQVILVNPTDSMITGTVGFLGPGSGTAAASPVILTLDDGFTGSDFDYSIPPRSSQRFTTSNPSGALKAGSVRATPNSGNAAPSGLVVFSYAPAGKTLSEAGVPALPKGSAFRVYAEASGMPGQMGSINTGLAITNVAQASNTVTLEVTNLDGSLAAAPETLTLPPSGQVARFLNDIFSLPDNFSGVLRVTSTADVAIVALRLRVNENNEIKVTTLAPSNEMDPSISEERFFAHFADSGGWSTQFILFSGTAGQASSGTLRFIDASGKPLDLSPQP